jgi:hypothetical protein
MCKREGRFANRPYRETVSPDTTCCKSTLGVLCLYVLLEGKVTHSIRYGQDELHRNLNNGQQQFDFSLSKTRLVLQ